MDDFDLLRRRTINAIEWIQSDGQDIAIIIRANAEPLQTTFITPESFTQQAGFIVYPVGGKVASHKHLPLHREITGTPETLIVRKGKMLARFYDSDNGFLVERQLEQGDIVLLISGGHGFEMLEDTVLMEIKQGPYTGLSEKERFE